MRVEESRNEDPQAPFKNRRSRAVAPGLTSIKHGKHVIDHCARLLRQKAVDNRQSGPD